MTKAQARKRPLPRPPTASTLQRRTVPAPPKPGDHCSRPQFAHLANPARYARSLVLICRDRFFADLTLTCGPADFERAIFTRTAERSRGHRNGQTEATNRDAAVREGFSGLVRVLLGRGDSLVAFFSRSVGRSREISKKIRSARRRGCPIRVIR